MIQAPTKPPTCFPTWIFKGNLHNDWWLNALLTKRLVEEKGNHCNYYFAMNNELMTFCFALPDNCVAMVNTVVTPRLILAGTASMLIQNEIQEIMTIRMDGM